MGVMDIGFWWSLLLVGVPCFSGGYLLRSWVEREKQMQRARQRHPAFKPLHGGRRIG